MTHKKQADENCIGYIVWPFPVTVPVYDSEPPIADKQPTYAELADKVDEASL